MINAIIISLGFMVHKHEPCLYCHPIYKHNPMCFIVQGGDFVISCKDRAIANTIRFVDEKMTIKLKYEGMISRFDGIDIAQTRGYIKISNAT